MPRLHKRAVPITPPGLFEYPNGQTGFSGEVLSLFQALDRQFLQIASSFQSSDHSVPAFLPVTEIQKIDYLGSFPHLVTLPICLNTEPDNLQAFTSNPTSREGYVQLPKTDRVQDILTPAACYHFYIQYQGAELSQPLYLTTRAHCFRRESSYTPLERQWCFNMREIVCIGTNEEVQSFLENCRKQISAWTDRIGIEIKWCPATDPFFNPAKNPKYLVQKLEPNKTEMVFEERLALGSQNYHRNYFGEAFKIRRGREEAYSGCVAFGLERWMSAILSHFGTHPKSWPSLQ